MITVYCLRFETPPTWRARSHYLYPSGTGWHGYTPRHWVPFSSPPTTRKATVEVFDPLTDSESDLLYDWQVKAKVRVTLRLAVYRQSVRLGVKPLETHDQRLFQLNSCGNRPYVTFSLMRRRFFFLWICLAFRQVLSLTTDWLWVWVWALCYDRRSVGQSASLPWNKAPIWGLRPDLDYCRVVAGLLMWGALSDERTDLLFASVAGSRQRSHSRVWAPWDSRPYFTVSDSRLPFSSAPTTRRDTVEVFDPTSTTGVTTIL
jgi:hypothetical protein